MPRTLRTVKYKAWAYNAPRFKGCIYIETNFPDGTQLEATMMTGSKFKKKLVRQVLSTLAIYDFKHFFEGNFLPAHNYDFFVRPAPDQPESVAEQVSKMTKKAEAWFTFCMDHDGNFVMAQEEAPQFTTIDEE